MVQWLNAAAVSILVSEKLENFHKIQEFLLRKAKDLLPQFLPEVLNFSTDKNADLKKALVGFIEEVW